MKIFFITLALLVGFLACSSKSRNYNGSYNQANQASENAHESLQRDVK